MASKALKAPVFRTVSKRAYGAQTATSAASLSTSNLKATILPNKLAVTTVENNLPISRVSVLYRAGSRNETWDNLGVSHMLRIAAGLSTRTCTQFGITRNIQQVGGNLTAQVDRETVSYTIETKRDVIGETLPFLEVIATKQVFKPWELSDNLHRLKYELAGVSEPVQALDLLHKAAYRTGLGNSVFCPSYMVGKHSSETLQHYVHSLFKTNRAAVVGVGIEHDCLLAFAKNLEIESGDGPQVQGNYYGGEQRQNTSSNLAHVAVAVEGTSVKDIKQALTYATMQYALGVGPSVKWGESAGSPLNKAVSSAVGSEPFAISALNIAFTDSGLFGFLVSTTGNGAGKAVNAGVKLLRAGKLNSEDIKRGKNQLRAAILMGQESASDIIENIGQQALLRGEVLSPEQLVSVVDSLKDTDINTAAKNVACGLLSIGAVGRLTNVPYVDDLCN